MKLLYAAAAMLVSFAVVPAAGAGESTPAPLSVQDTRTITIDQSWQGLSMVAPTSHFVLQRERDDFTGAATYCARPKTPTKTVPVKIPADKVRAFLDLLANAPRTEGPYRPTMDHTDDYPSLSIELKSPTGTVSFFSRSQGKDNIPWGLKVDDKICVIDSNAPSRALALLDPYLHRDALEALIQDVEHPQNNR